MTEHVDDREDDLELDRRLTQDLAARHADLDRALDLDAGLTDATLPGRVLADTDDLDQVLDLDAGLAAILSSTHGSDTATERDHGTTPADDGGTEPGAAETREVTELLRFARDLASMPADERLRTRLWLPRPALSRIRALVRVGRRTRNDLSARARALALALAHVVLNADLAGGRAFHPIHVRTHALALSRNLNRIGVRDLDRDLVHHLHRALHSNRVRDLDRARVRAFARDLDLDLALDRARSLVLDLAGTAKQPVMSAFVRAVAADRSATNLREEDLLEAVGIMERVVSDAVGADLKDADLTGIPLVGVRWSSTTRWPPAWRDQVHRESAQIGPDLWEIGDRGIDAEHFVTTT